MQNMKINKQVIVASIIIAILLPAFFYTKFLLSGDNKPMHNMGAGFIYSFIVSISIFMINIRTYNFLRKKYRKDKKHFKRISSELLITNFNAVIIIIFFALIFSQIFPHFGNQKLTLVLFNSVIVGIIINTFTVSILEGYYYFKQWKISLIQTEQLKRENIQSQFEALKNQIDPHFLFNSMNTVYSLIDTHPDKAKEFITKFSKTYRHVLDAKEQIVVSVKEEIEFLNSYIYLQKIRHEGNLKISINIDANKLNNFIPPLSLQMLVENALKHNIVSEKRPLKIIVFNNDNSLIVKNNLQAKSSGNESTKIGLNNLTERYKHISEKAPEFYIKDNEYVAEILLLNDEHDD